VSQANIKLLTQSVAAIGKRRLRSPLKRSNVELIYRGFAGWGKDEPARLHTLLAPECELIVPDSIPYGGTFRGPDAFVGWFTHELWRWFDEFTSTPEAVIDAGEVIVVPVNVKARAKNRRTMDVHNLWVYEFRGGKLLRARVYADTAVLRDVVAGMTA
jgi:ketosteroid isomerase-like protein